VDNRGTGREKARRPVSRVLYPGIPGDGHSSGTRVTPRLARPTRAAGPEADPDAVASSPLLFGLAPGGVCRATPVAGGAVRSYRTLSPLPAGLVAPAGGLLSVALSLGSPPPGVTRHRASVEPGLSSPAQRGSGRPAAWPSTYVYGSWGRQDHRGHFARCGRSAFWRRGPACRPTGARPPAVAKNAPAAPAADAAPRVS